MAQINSSNWMTTFFYQQDLTSYYMNGVLNGGLHPGIYNANFTIFTRDGSSTDSASNEDAGIYLYIKKGTTLIFSNSYNHKPAGNKGSKIEKDLNSTGDVVIKCVALNDDIQELVTWNKSSSTPAKNNLLGNNRKHTHFVVAKLTYNKKATTGMTEPVFFICDKNEKYEEPLKEGKDNYYYIPIEENNITNIPNNPAGLPDGSRNFGGGDSTGKSMYDIHWLCCGILQENPATYDLSYIGSNPDVTSTPWAISSIRWLCNHAFTGRGLPEYRYDLGSPKRKQSPDFCLSIDKLGEENQKNISSLYLDLKDIRTGNLVISKENKIETILEIGTYKKPEVSDYSFEYTKDNPVTGETIVDAVFLALKTDLKSDIQTVNYDSILHEMFNTNEENKPYEVVSLQFKTKLPDSANTSVAFDSLEDSNDFFSEVGTDGSPKIAPERLEGKTHTRFQTANLDNANSLTGKYILPLDVSTGNFERLLDIVKNNNIIPNIVSYMRKQGLLASDINSMAPICLAFRTEVPVTKRANIYADMYSSNNIIHPANILSFFDMASNTTTINNVPVELDDIYTVLPII